MPKEQLYLQDDMRPADEPPEHPDVRDAIHHWLDAKDEQAAASERTKAAADSAMAKLKEHELDGHPYIDPKSGKRKFFVADTTPKPKTMSARARRKQEDDVEIGEEVEAAEEDNVVEKRRVSRASVEAEIDPFAATRAAMTDVKPSLIDDAKTWGAGGEVPPEPVSRSVKRKKKPTKKTKKGAR